MLKLKAVIFGAIGVIAETSDLQRQAFNLAFAELRLNWTWDASTYRKLLTINGGQARLRHYRDADLSRSGVSDEMIAALHDRKTHHYSMLTLSGMLEPRPGVVFLMDACKAAAVPVALCTSTSIENVNSIRAALGDKLDFSAFASIMTIDKAGRVKPEPDAYLHCLSELGLAANEVVAIEDTPVSMASALAAHIRVISTPGAMTADQDFNGASLITHDLANVTLDQVDQILVSAQH